MPSLSCRSIVQHLATVGYHYEGLDLAYTARNQLHTGTAREPAKSLRAMEADIFRSMMSKMIQVRRVSYARRQRRTHFLNPQEHDTQVAPSKRRRQLRERVIRPYVDISFTRSCNSYLAGSSTTSAPRRGSPSGSSTSSPHSPRPAPGCARTAPSPSPTGRAWRGRPRRACGRPLCSISRRLARSRLACLASSSLCLWGCAGRGSPTV
ncbi:hypothetical protein F4825DRAFT_352513 [Nemania diffusa]|nr:hypothetical protein F4825DRAFT_352513 [Nemania diffusa]